MKGSLILVYIILAILVCWVAYTSFCDLQFKPDNAAAFYVGVLGALITFLVAWQIWQVIDTKDTIKEFKREFEDIKNRFAKEKKLNQYIVRGYNLLAEAQDIKHNQIDTELCSSGYLKTAYALYYFILGNLDLESYEINRCIEDFGIYLRQLEKSNSPKVKKGFCEDAQNIDEIRKALMDNVNKSIDKSLGFIEKIQSLKKSREEFLKL